MSIYINMSKERTFLKIPMGLLQRNALNGHMVPGKLSTRTMDQNEKYTALLPCLPLTTHSQRTMITIKGHSEPMARPTIRCRREKWCQHCDIRQFKLVFLECAMSQRSSYLCAVSDPHPLHESKLLNSDVPLGQPGVLGRSLPTDFFCLFRVGRSGVRERERAS